MSNSVMFTCTRLEGTGKSGIITPDEDGYYDIVVGGLNVFNSIGQFYDYERAKHLFQDSSQFMRRIERGVLGGEVGHPKPLPGMSAEAFASRCLSIYEDNVCCHHRMIYLDDKSVKDERGQPIIAIRSKLKPAGPKGAFLKEALENKHQNVCFSIRAFTDDFRDRGITKRVLRQIVTWDYVTEPGLALAEKYKSPALENLLERVMTRGQIERAMDEARQHGVALESSTVLTAQGLFAAMGWEDVRSGKPKFMDW